MAKKWFWSDPHLCHADILTFKDAENKLIRPGFDNIKQMNECLLDGWNSCCKPGDKGYWLGDTFCGVKEWEEARVLLYKFHGNLAMFLGNHDHIDRAPYRRFRFIDLWSGGKFSPQNFVCSHIPLRPDQMRNGGFNVHGHIHQNLVMQEVWLQSPSIGDWYTYYQPDPHYINVCVEHTNYKPVELDDIIARIESAS